MKEEGDYAGYNYVPFSAQKLRIMRKIREDMHTKDGNY